MTAEQRAEARCAIKSRVQLLGLPVEGEEHEFYDRIAADYQDALTTLGLVGFWILEDRVGDDSWIDGLSVGCPDGERVEVPDPSDAETEAAFAVRVVAFFEGLAVHRVAPAVRAS